MPGGKRLDSAARSTKYWAVVLALAACSARAELPAPVAEALREAGIPETHVGIRIDDLDAARPLLQHGGDRALNPASVMKLVTTLVALNHFGPAHTFKTRVYLDGALEEGVLTGNLILQGGGDPGMTVERFWRLLREIRARGVREIRGDVLLDDSHYQIEASDPVAFDASPLRPYNAPPAALLVNFNTVDLHLDATGQARLDPPLAQPELLDQRAPGTGRCGDVRDRIALVDGKLTLSGEHTSDCAAIALNLLPPNATAAAWFSQLWTEMGGRVSGEVHPGTVTATARLLLEFDSPPVSQLVRDTNKFSNNVMAKMLFLNLGAARYGAPATWDKGERAVRAWLTEHELECDKLVIENGSGLSRIERLSAFALSRMLRWATRQPLWFEFAASLPAVGLEGTQARRLAGTATTGQAWLKSGSLNGVRSLAGYVRSAEGGRRGFVFLINHRNAQAAGRAQDLLIQWAAETLPQPPEAGRSAAN